MLFNTPDKDGNIDYSTYEEDGTKTEVVKKIGTTENGDNTQVRASGKDYANFNSVSSIDLAVEVVAFPVEDLAKMRGEGDLNQVLLVLAVQKEKTRILLMEK